MQRPLILFGIFLTAGILTARISDSMAFVIFINAIFLITAFYCFSRFKDSRFILCGIFIFFAIGSLEFTYMDYFNSKKVNDYNGVYVSVKGIISSEPDVREGKTSYILRTKEIIIEDRITQIDAKILLGIFNSEEKKIIDYGRQIEAEGQLNLPKGVRNPGGFDYRAYLAKSGISGTMYSSWDKVNIKEFSETNFLVGTGLKLRKRVISVVNQCLPKHQAGLLNGMLIGYTAGLEKEVQKDFSDAGLSHIMAVSGANVGFIVLPMIFIFSKLRIRRNTANSIILFVLFIFTLTVGFSPSVLRAVIMAAVILIAQMIRQETDIITSIAFSGMVLLIYSPYNLFDIGFQLSYAATLSIVLFFQYIDGKMRSMGIPQYISNVLSVTISAQIGVIPITAYYFNKISIISLASNLLVVPLTGIITILGLLMAVLGQMALWLAQIIGYVNYSLLSIVLYVTYLSARLPFSVIQLVTPGILSLAGYYALVFFFFWYKPSHKLQISIKTYGLLVAIVVIFTSIGALIPKEMEVVFLDVGEGDAAFIRTKSGKTVLIDGGGTSSRMNGSSNIGEMVVVPFLLDYGVTRLDTVIATHGHDDHIAGLLPVLEAVKVKNLLIPGTNDQKPFQKLKYTAEQHQVPVTECISGNRIHLDEDTYLDVLSPVRESNPVNSINTSLNNTSLVLKLHYNRISVLFTGDMEGDIEKQLLDGKVNVQADVLKVAHHGSVYSTGHDFLKSVNPKAAVISVGKNNFGHPSTDTLERIEKENIRLFRTDHSGGVVMRSNGRSIKLMKTVVE